MNRPDTYAKIIWGQFKHHHIGFYALWLVGIFALIGLYAPLLASSKPLILEYDGKYFFPLFRYLFYTGFYTKRLDIFYNIMMFSLPIFLLAAFLLRKHPKKRMITLISIGVAHMLVFIFIIATPVHDPATSIRLNELRQQAIKDRANNNNEPYQSNISWDFNVEHMNTYARINLLLRYRQRLDQHQRLSKYSGSYTAQAKRAWLTAQLRSKKAAMLSQGITEKQLPSDEELKQQILEQTSPQELEQQIAMPTLYQVNLSNSAKIIHEQEKIISSLHSQYDQLMQLPPKQRQSSQDLSCIRRYTDAHAKIKYIEDRQQWLEQENNKIGLEIMPFVRPFHWEDDAGGEQNINQYIEWWELTRINRKDLVAALIFGMRISLMVGLTAILIQLLIGIPIGSIAGYFGGKFDIAITRLLEIWEGIPTFFMLLLVIAITQSKSIFLVIMVLGFFGWTSISRFIRGEMFKQRNLPYVDACRSLGFSHKRIIFSHLLPNAIPPVLTLLPFAILAAITSEAGLSFLGLGEEGSCSWGILMDEGRQAFPGESYLLWPPAILLTVLLIAIALVGDALRDAFDPKLRKEEKEGKVKEG